MPTFRDKPLVTTTCLLFALAEIGREHSDAHGTAQFLWNELSKKQSLYDTAFKRKFPRATKLSDAYVPGAEEMTGNVGAVFKLASTIARRTYKPKPLTLDDAPDLSLDGGRISARESDETEDEDEESIDLAPQSLTLGAKEIEYMTSLAKLIGRSPRAVKRFLNCYRLIKVSLSPAKLKEFVQDGASYEYKAVMILLGIVTGAPKVSLYVIEEIENWKWEKTEPATVQDLLARLESNIDLQHTSDWQRLSAFLKTFGPTEDSAAMFAALRAVTPRVSRFSFRIARAEAAGAKRTTAAAAKEQQPAKSIRT